MLERRNKGPVRGKPFIPPPVLGDAELIVGMSPTGEAEHGSAKIKPEHLGSLDSRPIRELVEELLEGGKEAFEMRRLKYGF